MLACRCCSAPLHTLASVVLHLLLCLLLRFSFRSHLVTGVDADTRVLVVHTRLDGTVEGEAVGGHLYNWSLSQEGAKAAGEIRETTT